MSARINLPSGLVTFLFTDIEGSTRLAHMLGEDYRAVLHWHRRILRRSLSKAEGVELFTEGDSLFVAFPDARAALLACVEAQRALRDDPWPTPDIRPRVRMGLHSGRVVPYAGEYASAEVHRAARVAAAAHGGQVLCSEATARLVRCGEGCAEPFALVDLGLHRLRGFDGRERLLQVVAPGLDRVFPRPRTVDAPSHNLPHHPDVFVGRGVERAELTRLLDRNRQVTMVGPAGVGKTRLAVEVLRRGVDAYPDGVWLIDLGLLPPGAGSRDSGMREVESAVAQALGIRPEPCRPPLATLADHVAAMRVLFVLDTCDARPDVAQELARGLLTAGPQVSVLATSRQPLRVPGEVVWWVPPLSQATPPGGGPSEAVALLLDRARAARGGRGLDLEAVGDCAAIALAVDGVPLALELAAERLRVLTPRGLADRMGNLLGALDDGVDPVSTDSCRHRSLWEAVDWSYRSLPGSAAWLLRRLSVFRGAFDLAAAEWLNGSDALAPLAVLVDRSLVQVEQSTGDPLYRILAPIRAVATRRLVEAGEERSARDRHVEWCVRRATRDDEWARLGHADQPEVRTDPWAAEVRTAMAWLTSGGSALVGTPLAHRLVAVWRAMGCGQATRPVPPLGVAPPGQGLGGDPGPVVPGVGALAATRCQPPSGLRRHAARHPRVASAALIRRAHKPLWSPAPAASQGPLMPPGAA